MASTGTAITLMGLPGMTAYNVTFDAVGATYDCGREVDSYQWSIVSTPGVGTRAPYITESSGVFTYMQDGGTTAGFNILVQHKL